MNIKKKTWRTVIQLIITILTAIISTFFTESCIKPHLMGSNAKPICENVLTSHLSPLTTYHSPLNTHH